jgi:phage terminase small subunit
MGRPRKPKNKLELEGTYRADRHGSKELPQARPESMLELNEQEQSYYERFLDLFEKHGVCTEMDGLAIAFLSKFLCEWEYHHRGSQGEGAIAISDKGVEYLGPRFGAASNMWKRVRELMKSFGMTPSDRSGLTLSEDTEEDAFDALLKRSMN